MEMVKTTALLAILAFSIGSVSGDCLDLSLDEVLGPRSIAYKLNCDNENIDAATVTEDGKTYFFKGEHYWRLVGNNVVDGYPREIRQDWDGLPGYQDAAVTTARGRTLFFKGSQYWSFSNKKMDAGYPRLIRDNFCGVPDNVDAATLWSNDASIYFFKDDQYWRFQGKGGSQDTPFPEPISKWKGLTGRVDAALKWTNGVTYFLKGNSYYSYDNQNGLSGRAGMDGGWGLSCERLSQKLNSG